MVNIDKTDVGFSLSGVLSVASTKDVLCSGNDMIRRKEGESVTIDFSLITSIDSTAISLMLEWLRVGEANGKTINFKGISSSFESLIEVYGLAKVLPLGDGRGG